MDAKPFVLPRQYYRLLLVSPLPSASLRNKMCYPNIMTCFCSVTTPNNLDMWLYNRIATAASCARPEPGLDVGPLTLPANKRSGYPVRGVATACRRWQKRKYPSMVGVFDHNQQWLKTFLTRMLASPRGRDSPARSRKVGPTDAPTHKVGSRGAQTADGCRRTAAVVLRRWPSGDTERHSPAATVRCAPLETSGQRGDACQKITRPSLDGQF